jgi:hypothetical protein
MNKEQLLVAINNINVDIISINSFLNTAKSQEEFDIYLEKLAELEATLEDLEDDLNNLEFVRQNEQENN